MERSFSQLSSGIRFVFCDMMFGKVGQDIQTDIVIYSVCNQMGTVFTEMTSRTALTWYTVMKTAFKNKNIKRIFIMKILNFKNY